MLPRMPLLRPLPNIAFDASRTATLVAVRAADLMIVVPIESLRRAGVLGLGDDGAARRLRLAQPRLAALAARRVRTAGCREWPQGPGADGASAGGGASYWPRRRGCGRRRLLVLHLAAGRRGRSAPRRPIRDRPRARTCRRAGLPYHGGALGIGRRADAAARRRDEAALDRRRHALGVEEGDQRLADAQLDDGGRRR